jgi:tripartite-type tricarboxylate transporter receptor subunit TctC
MTILTRAALAATVLALAAGATAQTYPSKPVRYVVPFPAGGTVDIISRQIGQELSKALGQQVIIENRAGASAILGHDFVAKSAPDGHTLIACNVGPMAIHSTLYPKLPFDPAKDLTMVTILAVVGSVIEVTPSLPVKSIRELVALAKRRPGEINYATSGPGSSTHLTTELLKQRAGIDMVHIVYKGSGPAVIDTMAGFVQVMVDNVTGSLPHIRAGKLKALAVTQAKRTSVLPDVPTLIESGYAGFDMVSWQCVGVAAGTPGPIVDRLHTEIRRIVTTPEMRQRQAEQGVEVIANSPAEAARYVRDETAKWSDIVKRAGIRLEL